MTEKHELKAEDAKLPDMVKLSDEELDCVTGGSGINTAIETIIEKPVHPVVPRVLAGVASQ